MTRTSILEIINDNGLHDLVGSFGGGCPSLLSYNSWTDVDVQSTEYSSCISSTSNRL